MLIIEEPEDNTYVDNQHQKENPQHLHSANYGNPNDTSELFTIEKKEIYGKLVE